MAAAPTLLSLPPTPHHLLHKPKHTHLFSSLKITFLPANKNSPILCRCMLRNTQKRELTLLGAAGVALATALLAVGPTCASELPLLGSSSSSLQFTEPSNALSLPTWAVHVSSVVEWVTAMALVWQYGERSGYESWKGLSWGMVPLLGGALCACTWHFFYNSESLEVLVALQAALTVIGNATMCIAAYRIYKSSQESSKNS